MVNIQIMRAFVKLRRIGLTYAGLKRKIELMEKRYDKQFKIVFINLASSSFFVVVAYFFYDLIKSYIEKRDSRYI